MYIQSMRTLSPSCSVANGFPKMLESWNNCTSSASRIAPYLTHLRLSETSKAPEFSAPADPAKMTVNQQHLKQAWDTSNVTTRDDWLNWMNRIAVEFMKESPSHALRACMSLVDIHPPLAKELFNAAFLSCWGELYDQYQVRTFLCF